MIFVLVAYDLDRAVQIFKPLPSMAQEIAARVPAFLWQFAAQLSQLCFYVASPTRSIRCPAFNEFSPMRNSQFLLKRHGKSYERAIMRRHAIVKLLAGTKIYDRGNKTIMKTYTYRSRNAFILMTTSLLFLSPFAASQAMSSDAQSHRLGIAGSAIVQPVNGAARLIIRRLPGLGNYVIVNLSVDGVPVAAIGYGRTYEGFLPSGRHVLSVLPTPSPKWPAPWGMILDMRSGETYSFTAQGYSGHLILEPPGLPERPRGR